MQNPLPDRIRRAHDAAVATDRAGYLDPDTGLFVMTARTLSDRGYCCGNGCRHCPWPPDVQAAAGRPR
ncbi:MAG: hypothetical protein H6737_20460 [Alphaproteobacteria bacterium]|nr:hypothetical protein [Alphaproteobacteria bacterium]